MPEIHDLFSWVRQDATVHMTNDQLIRMLTDQMVADYAQYRSAQALPATEISEEDQEARHLLAISALLNMKATGLPALADDSGIAVDALNGEPGIYSARYGFDDSLDDWGRLQLLLKNTEQVPDGQRQAQFVCVITMVTPEGQTIQARGEIHGELLREPRGENGFGYDPIFYYPPAGMSTAEMAPEEKNKVSHRGNALQVFYQKLKEAGYADK